MSALPEWDSSVVRQVTEGIAAGEEAAFNRFYDRYAERLYRYALVLARGSEEAAREMLQETMLRVVRYLKPMPTEEVLWGWLTRVARTVFIDRLRRESRHAKVLPLPDEALLGTEAAPGDETLFLLRQLEEALNGLPPEEQALLREHHLQGRPLAELAKQRGTTPKAVESRLARLRRKLKQRMLERLGHE